MPWFQFHHKNSISTPKLRPFICLCCLYLFVFFLFLRSNLKQSQWPCKSRSGARGNKTSKSRRRKEHASYTPLSLPWVMTRPRPLLSLYIRLSYQIYICRQFSQQAWWLVFVKLHANFSVNKPCGQHRWEALHVSSGKRRTMIATFFSLCTWHEYVGFPPITAIQLNQRGLIFDTALTSVSRFFFHFSPLSLMISRGISWLIFFLLGRFCRRCCELMLAFACSLDFSLLLMLMFCAVCGRASDWCGTTLYIIIIYSPLFPCSTFYQRNTQK